MPQDVGSTQGSRVLDEKRDYQRILPDNKTRQALRQQGYTWVLSSNVSAVRQFGDSLIIRFHNGSVYEYQTQGDRFNDIISSNSKGRWVWNELRRKNVPYSKLGAMPLDTDIDLTDEEVMRVGISVQEVRAVEVARIGLLDTLKGFEELKVSTIELLR